MSCILHETQTLSPALIYAQYIHCSHILIEACENYQKRSWRNKYKILAANGPLLLTIPLKKGKNNQKPIKEVEISYDELWVSNHINTLTSAYRSAPFFDFYAQDLFAILESKHQFIYTLNMELLHWAMQVLQVSVPVNETKAFILNYDNKEIHDWRNAKMLKLPHLNDSPPYTQVFEEKFGFISNLSILDCIFCLGPESIVWLKNLYKWYDQ